MMRTDQISGSTTEPTNPLWFLGQICANLIGTSWHLVTQHAKITSYIIMFQRTNKKVFTDLINSIIEIC